ncbi:MAG: DUF2828 family protein [Lachnospiraceae bacterium]|nr:DUF2828 family protein [Lachnospiraceae bacterium]
MGLREAIHNEAKWTETWNGCDTLATTDSACLDMFGRAGAMRAASVADKEILFSKAFAEDKDIAVKLLFYTRDVRGGYGERDTFNQMFAHLASINIESVAKNLWAVLEFGRAKDLYALIGTPAEEHMWAFMKNQFELDLENMAEGNSVSLLAKWIATPDSKVEATKELGKKTAKALGYNHKTMREYKTKLRALRKYLDLPEAKMCAGKWDEIEYSKCASKFLLKNRKAFAKNDAERWADFNKKVETGEATMNMGAVTPCDIIHQVRCNYTRDLENMWNQLPDVCNGNALVMCDTSGSMTWHQFGGMYPIEVAEALAIYFAQRNKGDLKNMFMTFNSEPKFIELTASTLRDNYRIVENANWGGSTNLESAFDLLLKTCIKGNITAEEMPDALVIVSDMQINCVKGVNKDNNMTFYDVMNKRYTDAGYKMPQVVFWNVNAVNPTFHAAKSNRGVSLVSGYSPNVFKQVMENIGTTPYELMMAVVNSERYAEVHA